MSTLIRTLFNPLLSLALVVLATAYFVTFTTLLIKSNGHTDYVVGAMHSAYYGGMFLAAFFCEFLVKRWGYNNTFITATLITALSMLIMGSIDNPLVWVSMRFIAGSCMGLIYIVIESWLLSFSTAATRGQILAIYTVSLYFSQAVGQYFIDFIPAEGTIPFILSSIITFIAIFPLLLVRKINFVEENNNEGPNSEWLNMFRLCSLGVLGSIYSGIILSGIYSFIPQFAVEYSISPSILLSLTIFGGVILQWPIGWVSDRFPREKVLLGTCGFILLPSLSILFFPDYWNVLINAILLGGLAFTIYPQCIAYCATQMPWISFSSVAALLLMAYGIGSTIGPMIAAEFTSRLGSIGLFYFFAFWTVSLSLYGFLKKDPVPEQEIL